MIIEEMNILINLLKQVDIDHFYVYDKKFAFELQDLDKIIYEERKEFAIEIFCKAIFFSIMIPFIIFMISSLVFFSVKFAGYLFVISAAFSFFILFIFAMFLIGWTTIFYRKTELKSLDIYVKAYKVSVTGEIKSFPYLYGSGYFFLDQVSNVRWEKFLIEMGPEGIKNILGNLEKLKGDLSSTKEEIEDFLLKSKSYNEIEKIKR